MKDSLGDRMKIYEAVPKNFLMRRVPVIIRLDGKAFHTFTSKFEKPFDKIFMDVMQETTRYLVKNIQGCKLGFVQSDEISLLLTDYEALTTDAWFGYNVQKMASVSASMATLFFNKRFRQLYPAMESEFDKALFDSRCFNLSKEEVCNYFIWRQEDCTRNSIQSVSQANFSHKELQGLSCNKLIQKLLVEKDLNWNNLPTPEKRGCVALRIGRGILIDLNIPIFTEDRMYIEKFI